MPMFPGGDQFGNAIPNVQTGSPDVRGVTVGIESIGNLAKVGAGIAMQIDQNRRRLEVAEMATEAVNRIDEKEQYFFQEDRDYSTQVDRYQKFYKDLESEYQKRFDNTSSFNAWKGEVERYAFRKGLSIRSKSLQSEMERQKAVLGSTLSELSNIALRGGDEQYREVLDKADALINDAYDNGVLDESDKVKAAQGFHNQLSRGKVQQDINSDPVLALDKIRENLYGGLNAEEQSMYEARALSAISRADNQIALARAKAEKAAKRVLGTIEKQISTGIPATPEMWQTWSDVVGGTQYQDQFKQLAEAESQVQILLAKPISEQQQYLRERDYLLKSGGGSATDIQNFTRIKTAIEANIKQLQNEPLDFYQARTGDAIFPLQLDSLVTGSSRAQVASELSNRANVIRSLQQLYGPQVKMRPLLLQEVDLLSSTLNKSTPDNQAALLSHLKKSIDDDQVYMAAMQQLAPDAPVKALAGMLVAKERKLTLENNWLSDDVTTSSTSVAQALLVGESILNKTSEQRSADGNAKNFPVPPAVDFDTTFSSEVGDAFAGRPAAYNFAVQAIRSHYVGVSAQEGDLSGILDTKRLQHSIRSVLGNVVDVNGNGKVFAPWGMAADDFEEKAHEVFRLEMRSRGLDKLADRFQVFGLKNYSEDRYYVLQGRNILLDGGGNPVIIDLSEGE